MADVKWIKIVTDVFDDEKVILIESMPEADSIIVIWFKLLCLAGKQNRDGLLMLNDKIAYTDEMLATVFRRPVNIVRLALNTFQGFGMIEIVEGTICISNWDKHQNLDKLAQMREYNRVAKQKSRARRLLANVNDSQGHVNDSQENVNDSQGTDIEEDIEEDKEKEKNVIGQKRKRFVPPTLDEVRAYCQERKNNVDPKKFYDYFTASDWHDSKGKKVQSWKQKVITWEGYHNKTTGANGIPISNAPSDLDDIF